MRLGYPIKKYDKYADPVPDEVKDTKVVETGNTSDAVSGNSIVQEYLKAIGGREEALKITSMNSTLAMDMMGMQITGTEKKMVPNKIVTEFKMGANTMYKKVFDGGKGSTLQGPQKADFNEAEIKETLKHHRPSKTVNAFLRGSKLTG